jgi:glutamyl-tRNA synthetase
VRFAPSPTGFLHVGGARSALFNWLFARHTGGTFILRIEDTDTERTREEWVDGIQRTLRWLGLDWDEGPYRQSQRGHLYDAAVDKLLADGTAYRGEGGEVRFRTPNEGATAIDDIVRGRVVFEHEPLEDFVVQRSNGTPTFYLANAVDDVDMGITHVIRGEDLLPSTPRVVLLRHALGAEDQPVYAHLPLLLGQDRQKLSKRHGDVALEDYRDKGYLPDALRNYLSLLGWAPAGDREIVPTDEVIAEFRLEDVTKAGAYFDHQKLDHVNAEYIRALPVEEFVREVLPWLEEADGWAPEAFRLEDFEALAPLVQERVRTLAEVPGMVDFLFVDPIKIDEASWEKAVGKLPVAAAILDDAIAEYAACEWETETLHQATLAIGERHGVKLNKAQAPIRVAVTGRTVGPPLFESLRVLGRDRTLDRLKSARARL